jgi:NADPH-dependent 7-cyano-7-deazaguanine reductase QueF
MDMNNKKQSSIDWLISCITEDQMVKSKSLNEWLEIFEQAKAMHKEEIKEALIDGAINERVIEYRIPHYYNETFGGNQ